MSERKEQTKEEFLREKLGNFLAFTKSELVGEKYSEFHAHLKTFEEVSMEQVIGYFLWVHQTTTVPAHIAVLISTFGLTRKDFTEPQMDKFEQYMNCFIETVTK